MACKLWQAIVARGLWPQTPQEYTDAVRQVHGEAEKPEKHTPERQQTRYTYTDGPMYFLGQQIVRKMQQAGWPAKIYECYRTFERQAELYERVPRVTNAQPGESPHQFYEAVDIVHETKYWDVPEKFWEELAAAVRVVGAEYGVVLDHGHDWSFRDSAHIELVGWKRIRERYRSGEEGGSLSPYREPTRDELKRRFIEVLPTVWRQHKR